MNNKLSITLYFSFPCLSSFELIKSYLQDEIPENTNIDVVEVMYEFTPPTTLQKTTISSLANVKNIVLVASGKGGVGKSTTAANLALATAGEGAKVGILDADIYGPSLPLMFGVTEHVMQTNEAEQMIPAASYNIHIQSLGFLVEPMKAAVWRGPMASNALMQLIHETHWGELDYLFVDLPPGTGDIQLTLSQKLGLSGAVIVTTPQNIATADAIKSIEMFRQVKVPILGVVENMSYHTCSACGHQDNIFGHDGGEQVAQQYQVPLLGALPLDVKIRENSDHGKPIFIANPESDLSTLYRDIAQRAAFTLADFANKNASIQITNL